MTRKPGELTILADDETVASLDPFFFLDYAVFGGMLRQYASRTLEDSIIGDIGGLHRRLHFVNVVSLEYAALEDAGALLDAFLLYRQGQLQAPLAGLISYEPEQVVLKRLFKRHHISSSEVLYQSLKLEEWIPTQWADWFGGTDLKLALQLACKFFFEDCVRNQKSDGVRAFDKIRHGPLAVLSGRQFIAGLPDAPAILTPSSKNGTRSLTLYGFKEDDRIEERHRSIEFVQCNLRLIVALYVISRYPDVPRLRGYTGPMDFLSDPSFGDVHHLLQEVTSRNSKGMHPR